MRFQVISRALLPLAFAAILCASPFNRAQAGFLGHVIHLDYLFPDVNTLNSDFGNLLVDPTAVFQLFGLAEYTVSDTQLLLANISGSQVFYTGADFNGPSFFDVFATIDPILDVTINPATNLPGFDASRISFDEDRVLVNMQGLNPLSDEIVLLDVRFGGRAVPEPSSALLAGLGLGVLIPIGLIRKRARS
jgi:hypothetical protein